MPNTYSPTPQNPSYQGSIASGSIASGTIAYTSVIVNGFNGIGFADMTPVASMTLNGADVELVLNAIENGQNLKLEFMPEANLTPNELVKIMMFVDLIKTGSVKKDGVMPFVRANSLERHFKFTV